MFARSSDTLQLLIPPKSILEDDTWEGKPPFHGQELSICAKSSPAPYGSPATLNSNFDTQCML